MNTIRARALIVAGLVDMAASQGARAAIMAHMPPNAAFPGGAEGFALKVSGGRFNPELLVRLNQLPDQPDAPRTLINLLAPAKPKLSLRAGSNFEFALTFREFGGLTLPTFPPPDLKGGTSISFCVDERMFAVNLVISCSSRVNPGRRLSRATWPRTVRPGRRSASKTTSACRSRSTCSKTGRR